MNKAWSWHLFLFMTPMVLVASGCGFPAFSVPAVNWPDYTWSEWVCAWLFLGAFVLYVTALFKLWGAKRAVRNNVAYRYQPPPTKFKRCKYDDDNDPPLDEVKASAPKKTPASEPKTKVHSRELTDEEAEKLMAEGQKLFDEGSKLFQLFGKQGFFGGIGFGGIGPGFSRYNIVRSLKATIKRGRIDFPVNPAFLEEFENYTEADREKRDPRRTPLVGDHLRKHSVYTSGEDKGKPYSMDYLVCEVTKTHVIYNEDKAMTLNAWVMHMTDADRKIEVVHKV